MSQQLKAKHQEFFTVPRITFAAIGIDPLAKNNRVIIKHPISIFGHYILTVIFAVASIDYCLKNLDNMNEFTPTMSLLNQLIIALWKMAIYLKRRHRIHKLIDNIWQWNVEANQEESKIIASFSGKTAFISKLYCFSVASTAVIGLLLPILVKLFRMFRGLAGELEVPHKVRFYWNTSTPIGYTIAYIWNLIIINFIFSASVAIDTLFLWLVTNILIRFAILKQRFEKAAIQNLNLALDLIRENAKFHCVILDLAQELNELYAEIIFLQSLISCTQICFLVFRLMSKNISFITVYYTLLFLSAVAMQLFFYCYSGELIKEQSLMVCDIIFETFNWSEIPVRCQKNLQMIMLRSQRSCNITGIFFNLNLNLYLWFFKSAGSLITALKTFEEDV